jgi:thiol-disulfide isomerase/thioredoxin
MKKKIGLFLGIFLMLAAVLSFVVSKSQDGVEVDNGNEIGEAAGVETEVRDVAYLNKDTNLADIKREKGKVNIYMFWGNGCPHCKAQWETLETMRKKYPNDFNVYGFEVWYDHENLEILKKFAAAMGDDDVDAVPYTIIGEQSFSGAQNEEMLKRTIFEEKNKSFDIYFDKIK